MLPLQLQSRYFARFSVPEVSLTDHGNLMRPQILLVSLHSRFCPCRILMEQGKNR
jgi:hypothetical protein